jgi:DNA repair exonuclease SbcCD ATPase subunit
MSKIQALLDALDEREKRRQTLNNAEAAIAAIDEAIEALESDQEEQKALYDRLEEQDARIEARIEALNGDAQALKKNEAEASKAFKTALEADPPDTKAIAKAADTLSDIRAKIAQMKAEMSSLKSGDRVGDMLREQLESRISSLSEKITSQRKRRSGYTASATQAKRALAGAEEKVDRARVDLVENPEGPSPIEIDPDVIDLIVNPKKRADFLALEKLPRNLDRRIRTALTRLEESLGADRDAVRVQLVRRHLGGHFARAIDALEPRLTQPVTRAVANVALPALVAELAADAVSDERAASQTQVVADMLYNGLFKPEGPVQAFAHIYAKLAADELGYQPTPSALQIAAAAIQGGL